MPPFNAVCTQAGIPHVPTTVPAVQGFADGWLFCDYTYLITGQTQDNNGNPLANCTVTLLRTADNSVAAITASDGSGNYAINATPALNQYVVAYLPGSPDVAGTTVNTLVGS